MMVTISPVLTITVISQIGILTHKHDIDISGQIYKSLFISTTRKTKIQWVLLNWAVKVKNFDKVLPGGQKWLPYISYCSARILATEK